MYSGTSLYRQVGQVIYGGVPYMEVQSVLFCIVIILSAIIVLLGVFIKRGSTVRV